MFVARGWGTVKVVLGLSQGIAGVEYDDSCEEGGLKSSGEVGTAPRGEGEGLSGKRGLAESGDS